MSGFYLLFSLVSRGIIDDFSPLLVSVVYCPFIHFFSPECSDLKDENILVLPLDLLERSSHEEKTKAVIDYFGRVSLLQFPKINPFITHLIKASFPCLKRVAHFIFKSHFRRNNHFLIVQFCPFSDRRSSEQWWPLAALSVRGDQLGCVSGPDGP